MTKSNNAETTVDSQLWHACAGPLVRLPPANSTVFYIPRAHADHADCPKDFPFTAVPALVPCRVAAVELLADSDSDSVFARIGLVPLPGPLFDGGDGDDVVSGQERGLHCAKVLTQSDANNGGGFSVPKRIAEKILPPLNYQEDPPVQDLFPVDAHGVTWQFRHIFRGTPRRHLFTSGWSKFVNAKGLVAGDCLVFLKSPGNGIRVGIRRDKRRFVERPSSARVRPEDVASAVALAAVGRPFEVVYDPCRRGGHGVEFVVRAAAVRDALARVPAVQAGMNFMMEFEDDDDRSRIKRRRGTIAYVDPTGWVNALWKSIQVRWADESDEKPKNVTHVSPWQIEIDSYMAPIVNFQSPVSTSPRKKQRVLPVLHPVDGQFPVMLATACVPLLRPQECHHALPPIFVAAAPPLPMPFETAPPPHHLSANGSESLSRSRAGVESYSRDAENQLLSDDINATTANSDTETVKKKRVLMIFGKPFIAKNDGGNSNDDDQDKNI